MSQGLDKAHHRFGVAETGLSPQPQIMVMLALLVGLGLRLLLLGSKSFWLDETLSIELAADPQQLWASGFDHSHPPLYYALLHYWLPLGTAEFTLRLSSALVGSLAIPLSYLLALDLGGRRVAYMTVWLVALSPLLVWYAQELRSYSLLLVWGLVMALALARLVVRPNLLWWLLFALATTAAFYTHYAALLLLAVQLGIVAVLYLQQRLRQNGVLLWLAAWPVVVLLYWPWLTAPGMAAFAQMFFASNLYPIEFLALRFGISSALVGTILGAAAVLALLAATIVVAILLRRGLPAWQRLAALPWVRVGVLLIFVALTVVAVVPRLYTVKKLVIALWPYGLLIVAWLFPWKAANRVAVGLLLVASLAGALVNVAFIPKDQWRMLAAYMRAHGEPTDLVWVVPRYQGVPLNYYFAHPQASGHPQAKDTGAAPPVRFTISHVAPAMSDAELAALVEAGQRVWLLYHAADFRLDDPDRRLQRWLDNNLTLQEEISPFRIEARLYAPRP